MSLQWVELALNEFSVVFLDVAHLGMLEQLVAAVHFLTQRFDGVDDPLGVGDDGFFSIGQLGQEVPFDLGVQGEFHLLGVHQYEFNLGRMFLVQDGGDDGVEPNRFSLPGGPCNQQVGHSGQVKHKGFVGDGLPQGNGNLSCGLLELPGRDEGLHRDNLGIHVGYFDPDSSLARHRGNDTDTQGGEAQGDVVLKILDARDADPGCWNNLIERYGWADGGLDPVNLDFVVGQSFHNLVLVADQFLVGDGGIFGSVVFQQIWSRELVGGQVKGGIVWPGGSHRTGPGHNGIVLHGRFYRELHIPVGFLQKGSAVLIGAIVPIEVGILREHFSVLRTHGRVCVHPGQFILI